MRFDLDGRNTWLDPTAWVAPSATVVGAVRLRQHASVWYGAVVRADLEEIEIGERSNIQDNCVLHADPGRPLIVGSGVTVGHSAVLHGCAIGDGVLVGMGAIVLNGARIEAGCIIGAGALVPENAVIPAASLVLGSPGRVRRPVAEAERRSIEQNAQQYVRLVELHRNGREPRPEESP